MSDSYYGRPVIKPVEWTGLIPAYFFCGGLAAGAALLAGGARVRGHRTAAQRLTLAATVAVAASAYCLIFDLGRPRRFHHMLRVFKPTSPMSVGTYVFTAFGGANVVAALAIVTGRITPLGRIAEGLAATVAPALATYTAVLIGDTSVPAWHEGRRTMPFVFAATSAASAGAVGMLIAPRAEAAASRRIALAGAAGALAGMSRLHGEVGPLVAEAYTTGHAGRLQSTSRALMIAGALGTLLAKRSRACAVLAGAALFAGSACERFGIFEAGRTAAKDPKYTVELQRVPA